MIPPDPPEAIPQRVRWVLWNVKTRQVIDVEHQDPAESLKLARKHLLDQHLTNNMDAHWAWQWAVEVNGCIEPEDSRPLHWQDEDLLQWAKG